MRIKGKLIVFAGLLFFLGLPLSASADKLSARDHAIAMLLLGDSDLTIKLGGKSVIWFNAQNRQLTDLLAEVVWGACSGNRQMEPDTLSWLAKSIGSTKQQRYTGLLEACLVADINLRTKDYVRQAKADLTESSAETFNGGDMDLSIIRTNMTPPRTASQKQLSERFGKLYKNAPLAEIYSSLGFPDETGVSTVSASNRLNQRIWLTALKLTYKGVGEIQFYAEEGATDWKLDNAVDSNGMMLSSYDGRFRTTMDLIEHGDAVQLREIADYLVTRKSLSNEEFEAVMERDKAPVDPADERLADSLGWLERAALSDGNANHEKKMTMSLLDRGDGLQLRHTAEYWLSKDMVDGEVLDAMMTKIKSSSDTKDAKLADGLAYLCKVIKKSGNAKYNDQMMELAMTAGHKTLRRYAALAAKP